MSHFLDRLTFFKKYAGTYSGGHGVTTVEDRQWENASRPIGEFQAVTRPTTPSGTRVV